MRVIDMECSVPKRENGAAQAPAATATPSAAPERVTGYGMANYERIFRSRRAGGDTRPHTELADYVDLLERVGIVRAVPFGTSNDEVADLMRDFPGRFIGLARISGLIGMRGARELERRGREQQFRSASSARAAPAVTRARTPSSPTTSTCWSASASCGPSRSAPRTTRWPI